MTKCFRYSLGGTLNFLTSRSKSPRETATKADSTNEFVSKITSEILVKD